MAAQGRQLSRASLRHNQCRALSKSACCIDATVFAQGRSLCSSLRWLHKADSSAGHRLSAESAIQKAAVHFVAKQSHSGECTKCPSHTSLGHLLSHKQVPEPYQPGLMLLHRVAGGGQSQPRCVGFHFEWLHTKSEASFGTFKQPTAEHHKAKVGSQQSWMCYSKLIVNDASSQDTASFWQG